MHKLRTLPLNQLHHVKFLIIFTVLFLLFSGPGLAADKSYRVGIVPQFDSRQIHEIWNPIFIELERQTGIKLTLTAAPSIPEFEKLLSQGLFDFAYMNPYHLLVANKELGYIPLVRDVGRQLYGVLMVKKDSEIERPEQLDGKAVSFPAPNALGASLMIRAELKNIYGIDIIPRYVLSHSSVYLNTALGLTAAGGGVEKTLNKQPDNIKNNLRVLLKTKGVAPHPFAAHPRVAQEDIKKIRAALIAMGESKRGAALLARIPMKKIGIATLDDYLPLKEMRLGNFYVPSND